jgi:hypothetical protein
MVGEADDRVEGDPGDDDGQIKHEDRAHVASIPRRPGR